MKGNKKIKSRRISYIESPLKKYLISNSLSVDNVWMINAKGASYVEFIGDGINLRHLRDKSCVSNEECIKEALEIVNHRLQDGFVDIVSVVKRSKDFIATLGDDEEGEHVEDILVEMDLSYKQAVTHLSQRLKYLNGLIDTLGIREELELVSEMNKSLDVKYHSDIKTYETILLEAISYRNTYPDLLYNAFWSLYNHIDFYCGKLHCESLLLFYINELHPYVPISKGGTDLRSLIGNEAVKHVLRTKDDRLFSDVLELIEQQNLFKGQIGTNGQKIAVDGSIAINVARYFAIKDDQSLTLKYIQLARKDYATKKTTILEDPIFSKYRKEITILFNT